ncbi:hypothetical protein AX767_09345 [Variovorax sp. PAMC 28711]|nr:hypothetical protein AX767_09345 [Variovorax sp. PAMC 28711]
MQRRTLLGLSAGLIAAAALPACAGARASSSRWLQIEVQDRDSGATLPVYSANGQWYVAGRPGARYGVTLRNLRRERVLVVMSVDGVNVLTGQTAGTGQDGYVLGPLESGQIAGWRKNDREIAAFEFTAPSDSYAVRTGRSLDVGVIGVAVFRERQPEPLPAPPMVQSESSAAGNVAQDTARAAPSPAPSSSARRERATAEQKLGTGHGQRETSVVGRTAFERASSRPDEVMALRYDSRANLIAQGVIPAASPSSPRPRPFPQSPQAGFVPDPPAY